MLQGRRAAVAAVLPLRRSLSTLETHARPIPPRPIPPRLSYTGTAALLNLPTSVYIRSA